MLREDRQRSPERVFHRRRCGVLNQRTVILLPSHDSCMFRFYSMFNLNLFPPPNLRNLGYYFLQSDWMILFTLLKS